MESLLYVLLKFADICIDAIMLLMLVRAVLSWFPGVGRGSKIMQFIYMVTELFISPVRRFLSRFNAVRGLPIDLSFLAAYILLGILQAIIVSLSNSIL